MESVFEGIFGPRVVGVQFVAVTCVKCGVTFGVELAMHEQLLRDQRFFSCPNGHRQHYLPAETAKESKKPKEAQRE